MSDGSLETLPEHLYGLFAGVGRALADPTRLRVLNLLAQTERSVDDLAERLGHSAPNTSMHLKVLQQAMLVSKRREGRRVFYRIAGDRALRLWLSLRDMGLGELPAAREAMATHASEPALRADLWGEALLEKVRDGELVLLDLRPPEEFAAGHLPGARSFPLAVLDQRLHELSGETGLVAYCRGPFCVAAIEGVRRLRAAGFETYRVRGGVADWLGEGRQLEH